MSQPTHPLEIHVAPIDAVVPYMAFVNLPGCGPEVLRGTGKTKEAAIKNLIALFTLRLERATIVERRLDADNRLVPLVPPVRYPVDPSAVDT